MLTEPLPDAMYELSSSTESGLGGGRGRNSIDDYH